MMEENNVEIGLNNEDLTCCITEYSCCSTGPSLRFTEAEADALSKACKALSHPVRLQIVGLLNGTSDEVCVCDIESHFSLKQPTISHHLKILRQAGLIDCEQRGLWVYYRATASGLTSLCQKLLS